MAGVGKTALAVHWAHQVAHRFADGQLYVNLRGFDPAGSPATPDEAIRELLDGLAVPAAQIPPGLPAQAALYRSLLAGRRMLVVLDNARDEQQVRPLLPGGPGCLVLITSRRQLAGLAATDGARLLTLDVLPPAEARQMLTARLGAGRAAAEPAAVTQIAALCAHLPLALAIAAARAAARPRAPAVCPGRRAPRCRRPPRRPGHRRPRRQHPRRLLLVHSPPHARPPRACSACSACTPAPTSPPAPPRAWPESRSPRPAATSTSSPAPT